MADDDTGLANEAQDENVLTGAQTGPETGNEGNDTGSQAEEHGAEGAEGAEQGAASDNGAAPADKGQKKPLSWEMRRIHEETNKRREIERERDELRRRLEALESPQEQSAEGQQQSPKRQTGPDRAAVEEARRQIEAERQQQDFVAACNRVFEEGTKAYGDFVSARDNLVEQFGDHINSRPDFLEAIVALDNGHDVFYDLASNPERTDELLRMSPVKMAVEIAKMGSKPKPAAQKPISKAPPPVKPVNGAQQVGTRLDDADAPMDVWAKEFAKTMAGRIR